MLRQKLFETLWKRKHLNIRGVNWTSHFTPFSSDLADKAPGEPAVQMTCSFLICAKSFDLLIYFESLVVHISLALINENHPHLIQQD